MRLGLAATGNTVEKIVRQAQQAEEEGFASLWFTSGTANDPLVPIAIAARATSRIELGTAILQSYTCHPALLAARAASVADAIGAPDRFTLGIGPSHEPFIEGMLGIPYTTPGRHTEEYVAVLAPLLRGEPVRVTGEEYTVNSLAPRFPEGVDVPLIIAALGPRLLRVAGERTAGTIPWMANAAAIEHHVAPTITRAAEAAGRPAPRIIAGLPVAVHDDVAEAREAAAANFGIYATLVNYQRIFERGGIAGPAEAALVGDEAAVTAQITALFDAGATEVWLAPFPVGDDRSASRARTRALLVDLAST